MIELIDGLPDAVVGLEAVGEVQSADYEVVAAPAVKHALERHPKIRRIHVLDDPFTGYAAGGAWQPFDSISAPWVITDPLGSWNTRLVSDGNYVIRLIGTDDYLNEWHRETRACGDDLDSEASSEAERLERSYSDEALDTLVRTGGLVSEVGDL